MSETPDPSENLVKEKYAIVEKEFNENPQKVQQYVDSQMVLYGGQEKALEKLENSDISKTPRFFRRMLGKLLKNALPEIKKMGISSDAINVFNKLVENSENTVKRIKQGGRRRSKTFRKKRQLVGGGRALTTLIIFLITISYMASAFAKIDLYKETYKGNVTNTGVYDGFGEVTKDGNTYRMKFENGQGIEGVIDFSDGSTYIGQISGYRPSGYGLLTKKDGTTVEGYFDDNGTGDGEIITPQYKYKGIITNYEPTGYGQKIINGKAFNFYFENGNPVGNGAIQHLKDGTLEIGKIENENIVGKYNIFSKDRANEIYSGRDNQEKVNNELERAENVLKEAKNRVEDAGRIPDEYKKQERMKDNQKYREVAAAKDAKIAAKDAELKRKLDFEQNMRTFAAPIATAILIIIFTYLKQKSRPDKLIVSSPSNPDYLAIILAACKTLFFGSNQILIKRDGLFGRESYQSYSYEDFLKDVNKETGDRIRAALRLLSNCKMGGTELISKYGFLNGLDKKDEEEIVHTFLDELSQTEGGTQAKGGTQTEGGTQTKGGAHQIIKKSPLQKRNAQTTKKNKLRGRARSRSRAFARS